MSRRVDEASNVSKKLWKTLEHVSKRSERKSREDSPSEAPVEPDDPGDDADVSAASGNVEDTREKPKKLREALERARERMERKDEEDSPRRLPDEPDEPDDEAVVPGDPQNDPEGPKSVSDERVDETNAPCRRNGPGGHLGEPEASRGVEGVRNCGKVVDGAEHNGIRPSSRGNEREVVPNPPCRDRRPRGHSGEQESSRVVEGDWRRRTDVEGVAYDWERREMDGATSGARRDSKRAETDPLAIEKEGQRERRKRTKNDLPRPSTPPPEHPRPLTDYVDPPR